MKRFEDDNFMSFQRQFVGSREPGRSDHQTELMTSVSYTDPPKTTAVRTMLIQRNAVARKSRIIAIMLR